MSQMSAGPDRNPVEQDGSVERVGTDTSSPAEESSESPSAEEPLITFSESLFFPTSSDAIWQSSTIVPDTLLDDDLFGSDEQTDDEANLPPNADSSFHFIDGDTSEDDDFERDQAQQDTGDDKATPRLSPLPSETALPQPQIAVTDGLEQPTKSSAAVLSDVSSSAQHSDVVLHSNVAVSAPSLCQRGSAVTSLVPRRVIMGKEERSSHLSGLYEQVTRLKPPGPDADVEELEEKFDSGLRLLDDLVHANTSEGNELKSIYDAYYNFAHALFEDIKEPSRLIKRSKLKSNDCDVETNSLEQQKEKIAEQERLLEEEILHYKATKRELKKIAEEVEEASKSYRKPEILEDVVIPKDIKLSSSSEYVAEIEELQEEILKKQDALKEIRKEIQHRLLPKSLVDSVCESHRLAMQSLRDIEEETAYLKECISRLDLKYLYNLQIS